MDFANQKAALEVKVEDRPATTLAYVRHVGPYAGDTELFGRLFGRIFQWAGPRGLLGPGTRMLTVYHDDPGVTPPEKLRISTCLTVPAGTAADRDVGVMELPAARTAAARFEIDACDYAGAWAWVFGTWLPASGYQPADGLPYEVYLNDPSKHPQGKHVAEICVPVKPL
jgi:AraC family transcriptional regulator